MHEVKKDGILFHRFDHLGHCDRLCHGVFTRQGGVSAPPFDSLNVADGLGDAPAHVRENRQRILRATGGTDLMWMRQVHGTRVHIAEKGAATGTPVADALITAIPGLLLVVQVADCQPVLLYDPRRHIAAGVHSGWKGSVANILGRTVAGMISEFGCRPADILAGIGPSLGPCCAEFRHYQTELPEAFRSYKGPRSHFDFWAISVDQLCRAGLQKDNIEVQKVCTRCHDDRYFSYRAEKITGRFAAVIGLSPPQPT
ncbi:MAG: peptidoglycan editing factor PgeF [Deltaproteobacteria bacterium]|nr:MAG: peptidoglycan editing factor PgeF [Deltaproteobacteria bacterium]